MKLQWHQKATSPPARRECKVSDAEGKGIGLLTIFSSWTASAQRSQSLPVSGLDSPLEALVLDGLSQRQKEGDGNTRTF